MKRRIGITRSTATGLGVAVCAAVAGVALAAVGGVLDTRFGNNGTVVTAIGGAGINEARAVAVQVDNKIVVAGYAPDSFIGGAHFTLARYNTDGTLDTTFSADGIVTTVVNSAKIEYAKAIAIQPDGMILVAGYNNTGGATPGNFVLIRYDENGMPDTTFDGDGNTDGVIANTIQGSPYDISEAHAIALQPDGKILLAGTSSDGSNFDTALVRYNTDGSLDTTFDTGGNSDGIVITPGGDGFIQAVALQPDGKILVAGGLSGGVTGNDIVVHRYTSSGVLDTTFSGDGIASFDIGTNSTDNAYALAVQPDGMILVAGSTDSGGTTDFVLLRLDDTGALDPAFDTDGIVITDFPITSSGPNDVVKSVVVQPDGKILAGGDVQADAGDAAIRNLALARYNNDGSLDATFSGDGSATTSVNAGPDLGHGLALRAAGFINLAGATLATDFDFLIAQYLANDADGNNTAESWDVTPDAFDFTDVGPGGVTTSSLQVSNTIAVSGLGTGIVAPVKVSGGEYSLNGGAWTTLPGYVANGDTLSVRHTAAGTSGTLTGTTLTVGGLHAPNNLAMATGCGYAETFTSITSGFSPDPLPPPGGVTGPTAACSYTDPLPSPTSHVVRGGHDSGAAGWPMLMLLGVLALRRRHPAAC